MTGGVQCEANRPKPGFTATKIGNRSREAGEKGEKLDMEGTEEDEGNARLRRAKMPFSMSSVPSVS